MPVSGPRFEGAVREAGGTETGESDDDGGAEHGGSYDEPNPLQDGE